MTREDAGDEGGTPSAAHLVLKKAADRCAQRYTASPSPHLLQDKSDWEEPPMA